MPGQGDTTVWAVRLDADPASLARLTDLLSPDELARASRFRRAVDRARFIAGRAQLRAILAERLHEPAHALKFAYSDSGKPSLAGAGREAGPHFNASGSDGLGLIAVRDDAEVGVDVERRRAVPDVDKLAVRLLAGDEHDEFARLPARERERRFFDAWVRKEAIAKMRGTGLTGLSPLERKAAQWVAPVAVPEPGYAAAVASALPFGELHVRWWPPTP